MTTLAYRVDYDERFWLPVPADVDDSWPERVVDHYAAALGELPPTLAEALRGFARAAQGVRTAETGQLLAFCPPTLAPAVGVIAVQLLESTGDEDLAVEVADDATARLLPAVETLDDPYWGEGRRAAVVTASTTPGFEGGRFNYALRRDDSLLVATAVADRIPWASVMLPYADRLVTSVRVEDA